jgi:hypothetical protein
MKTFVGRIITVPDGAGRSVTVSNWGVAQLSRHQIYLSWSLPLSAMHSLEGSESILGRLAFVFELDEFKAYSLSHVNQVETGSCTIPDL